MYIECSLTVILLHLLQILKRELDRIGSITPYQLQFKKLAASEHYQSKTLAATNKEYHFNSLKLLKFNIIHFNNKNE